MDTLSKEADSINRNVPHGNENVNSAVGTTMNLPSQDNSSNNALDISSKKGIHEKWDNFGPKSEDVTDVRGHQSVHKAGDILDRNAGSQNLDNKLPIAHKRDEIKAAADKENNKAESVERSDTKNQNLNTIDNKDIKNKILEHNISDEKLVAQKPTVKDQNFGKERKSESQKEVHNKDSIDKTAENIDTKIQDKLRESNKDTISDKTAIINEDKIENKKSVDNTEIIKTGAAKTIELKEDKKSDGEKSAYNVDVISKTPAIEEDELYKKNVAGKEEALVINENKNQERRTEDNKDIVHESTKNVIGDKPVEVKNVHIEDKGKIEVGKGSGAQDSNKIDNESTIVKQSETADKGKSEDQKANIESGRSGYEVKDDVDVAMGKTQVEQKTNKETEVTKSNLITDKDDLNVETDKIEVTEEVCVKKVIRGTGRDDILIDEWRKVEANKNSPKPSTTNIVKEKDKNVNEEELLDIESGIVGMESLTENTKTEKMTTERKHDNTHLHAVKPIKQDKLEAISQDDQLEIQGKALLVSKTELTTIKSSEVELGKDTKHAAKETKKSDILDVKQTVQKNGGKVPEPLNIEGKPLGTNEKIAMEVSEREENVVKTSTEKMETAPSESEVVPIVESVPMDIDTSTVPKKENVSPEKATSSKKKSSKDKETKPHITNKEPKPQSTKEKSTSRESTSKSAREKRGIKESEEKEAALRKQMKSHHREIVTAVRRLLPEEGHDSGVDENTQSKEGGPKGGDKGGRISPKKRQPRSVDPSPLKRTPQSTASSERKCKPSTNKS